MIFLFPDLETLSLALSSAMIPPTVSQEAAEVAFDTDGRPSVKSHSIPPKTMQNALKRLGVKTGKTHHGQPVTVSSWPEILPVVKVGGVPEFSTTAPILFELPANQLASFATEMLRLGNDRQSFRYLSATDDPNQRVLLRVIGPPYYTLLRAVDHLTPDVVAYVEAAPRVWIEIGCSHPLAANLKVPEGRLSMLRPPRHWTTIEDAPFHDIYDILDFQLPETAVDYAEGKLPGKLIVPLRLVAGNAADAPEMWVLKENAVEIFDAFVRDADERLMSRLMFAVAENGGDPTIVLRTRPSRLASPALELPGAIGYTSYRKLGNLFIPAGSRLQPTLRRDAVRKMLAEDADSIIWLTHLGEGRFAPESLPDDACRPLQDWVDYVIDHERQVLQNWVQATSFDFDSFICKGDLPEDRPPSKPKTRKPGDRSKNDADAEVSEIAEPAKGKKKGSAKTEEEGFAAPAVPVPPSELKIEREKLEKEFLAIEGSLEAPERLALWPRLANINAALENQGDAAICWLNALWERNELPAEWLWAWRQCEDKSARREVTAADLDRALGKDTPTQGDMRQLVAMLLYACTRPPIPPPLKDRLPEIRRYLERHDEHLGIRAVWLVWFHLSKISGDVLALARVRDRLIDQLLNRGLSKEYDVPRFIRRADDGDGSSNRLREILERTARIRESVRKWMTFDSPSSTVVNSAYADLMFAFGFASLHEINTSRELLAQATAILGEVRDAAGDRDAAHALLLEGFRFRIESAIAEQPHRGPLSAEWHDAFDQFREQVGKLKEGSDQRKQGPFIVERFREQSWIFEPEERFNPYRSQTRASHELNGEISAMAEMREPGPLSVKIKNMIFDRKKSKHSPAALAEIAIDVLPMCARVSAEFTRKALEQVAPLIVENLGAAGQPLGTDIHLPANLAKLLDRALALAVGYEVPELVKRFAAIFDGLLNAKSDDALFDAINHGAAQCIRSLRKNGMNDEIHALLIHIDSAIEGRAAKSKSAVMKTRVDFLCARLQVAGARLYLGKLPQAVGTLDEVRDFLFANSPFKNDRPWHQEYARLTRTYLSALSHAPIPLAMDRVEELFKKMAKVANTFTSATHYSRLHLNVIEEFVLCFMQPESLLGETARRWLDDDEYLVRRRIHADMRKLLGQSGLG